MTDFDYENLQKKRLAHQVNHRKSKTRGGRGVSLRQDTMTTRQLEKENGPVESYNLNAPMGWSTFCTMPTDLKAEYITKLRDKYDASTGSLAAMFGVSIKTLYLFYKKYPTLADPKANRYMTNAEKAEWAAFLATTDNDAEAPQVQHAELPCLEEKRTMPAELNHLSLSLSISGCPAEVGESLVKLLALLKEDTYYDFSVDIMIGFPETR